MTAVEHRTCRSCGSPDLTEVLSLGEQYVSDFPPKLSGLGDPFPAKIPITLDLCGSCTLVQQRFTAPSDFLYSRHYWYRSSVTQTMQDALEDVVRYAVERVGGLRTGDIVLDIGSNDGTLLRHYDSYSPGGVIKVGVEPANNLATKENYTRHGLELVHDFWPPASGTILPYAKAKVVTAIGMLYDLEDPNLFLKDVARVLAPDGLFVAQLQCLRQTVELGDVGNFCHEHLEFYSLKSLILLLGRNGLGVADVEENSVNGGSYRVYCRHLMDGLEFSDRVTEALAREETVLRLADPATYRALYLRASYNRDLCVDFLFKERDRGRRTWVYGASTKGNVILQWYGLDGSVIEAAADRSPEKWGRYTVGTGIPIRSEADFRDAAPDYALVLPYTFRDEFYERERDWRSRGGKFVFPLPEFEVV